MGCVNGTGDRKGCSGWRRRRAEWQSPKEAVFNDEFQGNGNTSLDTQSQGLWGPSSLGGWILATSPFNKHMFSNGEWSREETYADELLTLLLLPVEWLRSQVLEPNLFGFQTSLYFPCCVTLGNLLKCILPQVPHL